MAIPAPKEWYYARNDQPVGPIATEKLRELLHSGEVPASTLITPAPTYLPAAEYPELALHPAALVEAVVQPHIQTSAVPSAPTGINIETSVSPALYYSDVTSSLLKAGPWIRFLSILSYVFGGFSVLGGLCVGIIAGSGIKLPNNAQMPDAGLNIIIMMVSGYLYLSVGFYLWRYASAISAYKRSGAPADLSVALGAQFRFWRYLSILLIVVVVLYFVVGFAAAIASMPKV